MIMCKGDIRLGSGCGTCERCKDQIELLKPEMCSCGSRQKSKCVKESGLEGGKMCLKAGDSLYINFRETLNGGFCADIDYESDAWQRVLSDWEGFKVEEKK